MTAKQYLERYKWIEYRIKTTKIAVESLTAIATNTVPQYENIGAGHGSPNLNKQSDIICQIADLNNQNADMEREAIKILQAIGEIENKDENFILMHRYIHEKSWGWIIDELHLEPRWVYRLHGRALKKIKIHQ